jgi:hypothetical protein
VPADLSVYVPTLEDALLGLFNDDQRDQPASAAVTPVNSELIGGRR